MDPLILAANPGSASRKYAFYRGDKLLAKIHFEYQRAKTVYSIRVTGQTAQSEPADISHLAFAANQVLDIARRSGAVGEAELVKTIALRIVAPSVYFQADRELDSPVLKRLEELEPKAHLHINASLQEAHLLRKSFPDARLVGVSDSAFHSSLAPRARHYGIPLKDAKQHEIYRYGYHGLSCEAVVQQLQDAQIAAERLVVCHLGSGSSVTAIKNGRSIDTTMGYSPLEGVLMATRSGDIDIMAAEALRLGSGFSHQQLAEYLNSQSGLLGVSDVSGDIRDLLPLEKDDKNAALALEMYVYKIQQAIGRMAASLGGLDCLVFTGTVGERSAVIRQRIIHGLLFMGLALEAQPNHKTYEPNKPAKLSPASHPVKIYAVPADEDAVMARHAEQLD